MVIFAWKVRIIVWLQIYCYVAVKSDGVCNNGCPKQVMFSKQVSDYFVKGPIVMTRSVTSDESCQMQCIGSMMCDLFNLGPLDKSFRRTCLVLRYDFKNYIVQRKKGWSFRARKCISSPCKNGGTCFVLNQNGSPQCAYPDERSGQTCSEASICKSGWSNYKRFCYKVFDGSANFYQVNASCTSQGAQMVSIEDFDELRFLDSILQKGDKIFVGMTDIAEEGKWVWMDGRAPTLDPLWHGKHPDGGRKENCGEYQENHGFHDKRCKDKKKKYVCKYTLPGPP